MRRSVLIKVMLFTLLIFAVINFIKMSYLPVLYQEGSFALNLGIDYLVFILSSIGPVIWGNRKSKTLEIKELITELKENTKLSRFDSFNDLYRKINALSDDFKFNRFDLYDDYALIRFLHDVMAFFQSHFSGLFYANPERIKGSFKAVAKSLNNFENNQNSSHTAHLHHKDKVDIIEKLITLSVFYNFYYDLEIKKEIVDLFNNYKDLIKPDDIPGMINVAILNNDFSFDENILGDTCIATEIRDDLDLFFKIKNDSIKLTRVVNSIDRDFDHAEIFTFYQDFFSITDKTDGIHIDLILLIFQIELLSFYEFILSTFSKVSLTKPDIENLRAYLDIRYTHRLDDAENLGDYMLQYFYYRYKSKLNDYLNHVLEANITSKSERSYHPIFHLYYSLNTISATGINYSPQFTEITRAMFKMRSLYHKDIHIWQINQMNNLIRKNKITMAYHIYENYEFDSVHAETDEDTIYKYSILLCKSVFLNRLDGDYISGRDLLLRILSVTKLHSDIRDAKYLLFVFAFEKGDKPVYRMVYDQSGPEEKKKLLNTANLIRIFESIDNLFIGDWLYVSYPVSKGFALMENKIPDILA